MINGQEEKNLDRITNHFVEFFTNKVNGLLGDYEPDTNNYPPGADFIPFSNVEVLKGFDRLSNKKSSGMDGLSGFFIKKFKSILTPYLADFFNKIVHSNIIPSLWKIAKISPVHKKGSKLEVSNYRPVSNLLSLAKLFELCLLGRMENLDQDMIHSVSQHGFRKNHSTTSAVVEIVDSISGELDARNAVGVYSVDLTAAFDLLQKERLINILRSKDFPEYLINIIYSYLTSRFGYVQIDESVSCVREIKAGCIQGSVLGPVLYNIYTSSLEDIVAPCKAIIYADDAYVIASCDDADKLKGLLEVTLNSHFAWLNSLGMICNHSKTELIVFGSDVDSIKVGEITIEAKETMKVLGVLVDNKLNWEYHIQKVIKSCRSQLFALRYLRQNLSIKDTFIVFRSHIISKLTYCSQAWSCNLSYILKSKLKSFYYHLIRVLLRDFDFKLNRTRLLERAKLENLENILFKRNSVFVFKILKDLTPSRLACEFLIRTYANERHPNRLTLFDLSRSRIGKKSPINHAKHVIDKWNFDWTNISIESFKLRLKSQFP